MAGTSWTVPTSLLASITETSTVSGRTAEATAAGSMRPCRSQSTTVRSARPASASSRAVARTASCSMALTTRWRPRSAPHRSSTPRRARLSASVPPEVKTTSRDAQPAAAATRSRASSTAARARRPCPWAEEGLPNSSPSQGRIAARTSGSRGVVAAWSR